MAYNKFTITDLEEKLKLTVIRKNWISQIKSELLDFPRDMVLDTVLSDCESIFLGSEKSRSEFMVTPVLQALKRKKQQKSSLNLSNNLLSFSIFSGYEFNIDKSNGLNGFCDFILAASNNGFTIKSPILFVVETKKTEIDDNAIAQCVAELYAASLFHEKNNTITPKLYGAITSGYQWLFVRLTPQTKIVEIDTNFISLTFDNPYPVLQHLQWVLQQFNNF